MSKSIKQKKIQHLAVVISITIVGSLMYLFLWGKLFPYSPVKIGFSKHELSNTVVYVQNGAECKDFEAIDSYPLAVEKSHELRFCKKPIIYFFRDKDSYIRRTITKARFCAYPNGSLVVSPWAFQEAQEGKISLEIYLKHELSHTLLYEHMGIPAAYIYFPRWLLEGIAMYHSNQMGTSWYPSKKETYNYIRQGNFINPRDYSTAREEKTVLNVKYRIAFIYSEFGCIVDDLITTYGNEKFRQYIKRLNSAFNHEKIFKLKFPIFLN